MKLDPEILAPLRKQMAAFSQRLAELPRLNIEIPRLELGETLRPLVDALRAFGDRMQAIDWASGEEQMKHQRAALENPDDPRSEIWLETGGMTLKAREPYWRRWPSPLKRRGRPKGTAPVAGDEALFEEMQRLLLGSGMNPTKAALQLVGDKNRADYLVKLFKAR